MKLFILDVHSFLVFQHKTWNTIGLSQNAKNAMCSTWPSVSAAISNLSSLTVYLIRLPKLEKESSWRVAKHGVPYSEFDSSKCTHTWSSEQTHTHTHTHAHAHTHTHTHTWSSGAQGAVEGSVLCSRVSLQSWYWRWKSALIIHSPTYNPCQYQDSNLQPLCYKSDSLTIRPRLPQYTVYIKNILYSHHCLWICRWSWGALRVSCNMSC